ncbi:MAG: DUF3450 family protein [Xanthomonadales bacterium]|nr:DUF3450 family protein [Xanthomonadales bacterium]
MTTTLNRCFMACTMLTGIVILPSLSWADEASENLASRLVQMRGQVDELQSELSLSRDEHKNRMAFLTAQLTELEAGRDREALRLQQLETELEKMRVDVAAAGDSSTTLEPILMEEIAALRQQVSRGFPFKVGERLAELDEIESQLSGGVLPAQRAFNRLWAFVEDEMRISRENAIYSQSISLDGSNVLVDIAKLGNAMMYFRTRDLKYGRAVETSQGWRFELFTTTADQERTARLFDALRKQIRQGYFELPNALPMAAAGMTGAGQ